MSYRVLFDLFYLKNPVRLITIFLIYVITCNSKFTPSLPSTFSCHYIKSIRKAEFLKALIMLAWLFLYRYRFIRILYSMKTNGFDIILKFTKGALHAPLHPVHLLPSLEARFAWFNSVEISKGAVNG
jgi:hypothetical protein